MMKYTDNLLEFQTSRFNNACKIALIKFQKDYPYSTSADLQTFILGFRAAYLIQEKTNNVAGVENFKDFSFFN